MSTPAIGEQMGLTTTSHGPQKGDAWTGFEWVSPARYEELRTTKWPHLPPLQGTPPESAAIPTETAVACEAAQAAAVAMPAPLAPLLTPSQRDGYPDGMRIEEAIHMLLQSVDPDPDRGGLEETPERAAKAWEFWTSGYKQDPAELLKVFEDGAEGCDQMVVVKDIPFYSHCEHHLAPIFGTATVGYLPNGKIVGLSKLNRLVLCFARRLQVQERLTNQIAAALLTHLQPKGVGVLIKARHFCMESRGVQHQGCETVTQALHGEFRDDPAVRDEFLSLARSS